MAEFPLTEAGAGRYALTTGPDDALWSTLGPDGVVWAALKTGSVVRLAVP